MSIVSVKEDFRAFTHEVTAVARTAHQEWFVESNAINEVLEDVEQAPTIAPLLLAPDFDPLVICKRKSAKRIEDSQYLWKVSAEFEQPKPGDKGIAPWDREPEIDFDGDESREPIFAKSDGSQILNSAQDTPDPPIDIDVEDPVIVITRNEPQDFDPLTIIRYRGAVNSDTFFGEPAYSCKLKIRGTRQFEQLWGFYYSVTYRLCFREYDTAHGKFGWVQRRPNEGFNEIVAGVKRPIRKDGQEVSYPVGLDSSGVALSVGGTPTWIEVLPINLKPFAALNLEI